MVARRKREATGASPAPVVISMGDPGGIGPEVIVKALAVLHREDGANPAPIVCGDVGLLTHAAESAHVALDFVAWSPGSPLPAGARVPVLALSQIDRRRFKPGRIQAENGLLAVSYLRRAVELVTQGHAAALVTAPLSKAALTEAGVEYPGHTEMLAAWAGVTDFAMMLMGPKLRVVLLTRHVPLRDVPKLLTPAAIVSTLKLCRRALVEWFGIAAPRLALAGLNPHAGESGTIGDEEVKILTPALERARALGIDVAGPVSPDAVYLHAVQGRYDAVIAPYHDQGLIPLKLLHFDEGVNVTLGLPYVRTSPDHGTAFDIVGKNIASPGAMLAAIRTARTLAAVSASRGGAS